jgi:hypothetical protein
MRFDILDGLLSGREVYLIDIAALLEVAMHAVSNNRIPGINGYGAAAKIKLGGSTRGQLLDWLSRARPEMDELVDAVLTNRVLRG